MGTASYVERPVPLALATHACCVWAHVAGPDGCVQRVLPDGCADVVWIDGERLEVAGPATRPVLVHIPPGAAALGVRFGPGAAGRRSASPRASCATRTSRSTSCGAARRPSSPS